ncbi:MAG: YfiR family protein [Alphaproteobacteria bacterium]|nr:YfiR family protein [Alphaproteobacteria bacterium]MBV9372382.1 YfiR family protein [Alphaproteobacteria bacterium]MBV9902173.1 YfiR family protein [Alphaproteobacteria bacterium]
MRRPSALAAAALLAALALGAPAARAQPSDLAVKAAFLPKFAGYVGWPGGGGGPRAPLVLCVIGGDPFGRMIDEAVRGQQVDGRPIAVRRLAGTEGAESCQLAFVQGANPRATQQMLAALRGRPILTVTDSRAGPARGMIFFVVEGGRVRFHIDQVQAQQSGLTLNARLLAIALSVRTAR